MSTDCICLPCVDLYVVAASPFGTQSAHRLRGANAELKACMVSLDSIVSFLCDGRVIGIAMLVASAGAP